MRTLFAVSAIMFLAGGAYAQKVKESEVPKAVLDGFSEHFKGMKVTKWEKEMDGYEAEFMKDKVETSALFNSSGKLLQTETEMKPADLPAAVSEYVKKNHAGYKISEAAKIVAADGKIMYEAEVEKGKEEFDLIIDENGNFVKKEVETGEEKDDDKK